MSYINPIERGQADASVSGTLDAIKSKLGKVPNLFLTMAQSPVALNAYVQLADVASHGKRRKSSSRSLLSMVHGASPARIARYADLIVTSDAGVRKCGS